MPDDVLTPEENVEGPPVVRRRANRSRHVRDPSQEPVFQRIADKVSYGMGTPLNIVIWIVLVLGWTLLFALSSSKSIQGGTFLPAWFTSTGYNFPLNLVTTVAELYIGFLVGASSNRSERNLEATLDRIDEQEKQIQAVEASLSEALRENTELTRAVKVNTDLLDANTGLLKAISDELSVLVGREKPAP
jgi:cell shape-determining protein MreC